MYCEMKHNKKSDATQASHHIKQNVFVPVRIINYFQTNNQLHFLQTDLI